MPCIWVLRTFRESFPHGRGGCGIASCCWTLGKITSRVYGIAAYPKEGKMTAHHLLKELRRPSFYIRLGSGQVGLLGGCISQGSFFGGSSLGTHRGARCFWVHVADSSFLESPMCGSFYSCSCRRWYGCMGPRAICLSLCHSSRLLPLIQAGRGWHRVTLTSEQPGLGRGCVLRFSKQLWLSGTVHINFGQNNDYESSL